MSTILNVPVDLCGTIYDEHVLVSAMAVPMSAATAIPNLQIDLLPFVLHLVQCLFQGVLFVCVNTDFAELLAEIGNDVVGSGVDEHDVDSDCG